MHLDFWLSELNGMENFNIIRQTKSERKKKTEMKSMQVKLVVGRELWMVSVFSLILQYTKYA